MIAELMKKKIQLCTIKAATSYVKYYLNCKLYLYFTYMYNCRCMYYILYMCQTTKDKLDSYSTDNSECIPGRTVANSESLDDDDKARSEYSARLSIQVNKTMEVLGNYDENGEEEENSNVTSLQEVIQTTHHDDNEQKTSSVDIIVIAVDSKSTVNSRENEDDKLEEENGTNVVESRETLGYENSPEVFFFFFLNIN